MEANEIPKIEIKMINNVEISNLEIAKIAMVCDYLVVDRFTDISSFPRFEMCFGPLFKGSSPNFLFEAFTEICGQKKKIHIFWTINIIIYFMEIKIFKK